MDLRCMKCGGDMNGARRTIIFRGRRLAVKDPKTSHYCNVRFWMLRNRLCRAIKTTFRKACKRANTSTSEIPAANIFYFGSGVFDTVLYHGMEKPFRVGV